MIFKTFHLCMEGFCFVLLIGGQVQEIRVLTLFYIEKADKPSHFKVYLTFFLTF